MESAAFNREFEARKARLKVDLKAALAECDRGLCVPLDIDEIKAELLVELDPNGEPN